MKAGTRPSESQVLSLLDIIYQAAVERERWPAAVEAVAQALGGASLALSRGLIQDDVAQERDLGTLEFTGFADDHARSYVDHYVHVNPMVEQMVRAGMGFFDGREILDLGEFQRSEFYNEWMLPQDFHSAPLGSVHSSDASGPGMGLAIYRPGAGREFDTEAVRLAAELDPHLLRAARTCARVEQVRAERDGLLEALDRFETGVVLVDERCRVLATNRAAGAILRAGDGLLVRGGELLAGDLRLRRRLRERLARATDTSFLRDAGTTLAVPRPSGTRSYEVTISPIRRRLAELGHTTAAAIVFLADPVLEADPPHEVLAALYGLTPAEARVAAALARGLTPAEYADQEGRSRETVRSQLKSVLSKAGVRRQAELVGLLRRGLAALRDGSRD